MRQLAHATDNQIPLKNAAFLGGQRQIGASWLGFNPEETVQSSSGDGQQATAPLGQVIQTGGRQVDGKLHLVMGVAQDGGYLAIG